MSTQRSSTSCAGERSDAGGIVVVVDTDAWRHLFAVKRRLHPAVPRWRELLRGQTVVIATQTRAEILTWLLVRDLGERRRTAILVQLNPTPTVPINESVIIRYARLTADSQARGDALGAKDHTGDRWIAATALAIGAPLLTADQVYRHDPDLVLLDTGAALGPSSSQD